MQISYRDWTSKVWISVELCIQIYNISRFCFKESSYKADAKFKKVFAKK